METFIRKFINDLSVVLVISLPLQLFGISLTWASANPHFCADVYAEKVEPENTQSGFINIFDISNQRVVEQENYNPTKIDSNNAKMKELYFENIFSNRIANTDQWLPDFLQGRSLASRAIREMAKLGKERLPLEMHREFFKTILSIKEAQMAELSPRQLIQVYSLFARWNLLPPKAFAESMVHNLQMTLDLWTPRDFTNFALARKLTPFEFPETFIASYKRALLFKFSNLNLRTQLEVLGAELIHGTFFSTKSINFLFRTTIKSLNAPNGPTVGIKPLKELYRGLIFFRSQNPTQFFEPVVRLERAIEKHMSRHHGLSLSMDETSGGPPPIRNNSIGFQILQSRLELILETDVKLFEHSNLNGMGFYDPVDLYYPKRDLVVEWDGPQHYFRTLPPDGKINLRADEALRPSDRARDQSLRSIGISVLRFSQKHNPDLMNIDLDQLILNQNPGTWQPLPRFFD